MIGDPPLARRETLNFVIIRSNSLYNMLLGRTTMQKIGIVVSTIHGAIKFHTAKGIEIVFSTHESEKIKEGMKKISRANSHYRKTVTRTLQKGCDLLRSNADVFAWTHADITGIPRTIMVEGKPFKTEHKLNEYIHIKPIKQKRRSLCPDRSTTACKEVVKKSDGGWRICFDFTDINKACPKDCYPLTEIDWKIQMAEGNEDKTTFFAGEGVFCYRKMPFGLKNTGATYQTLVDKVFHDQIGRNLKAYVDDMVIKSTFEEDMLPDIKETFERFRSINIKLNPKKCSFGVEEGSFLGLLITKHGIRANHSKVKAITDVEQPKTLKDI
ncbi:reverse transcriptase domain-containing protein [Tanacetum coccineum]